MRNSGNRCVLDGSGRTLPTSTVVWSYERPECCGRVLADDRRRIGATSKWQSDGRNTKLAHGQAVDDSDLPVGVRWGVGGAVAQKFAAEGFFTVLTTRSEANAAA